MDDDYGYNMGDDLPGDWDQDEFMDDGNHFPPMFIRGGGGGPPRRGGRGPIRGGFPPRNFGIDRYNNAYGDYRGGYGPGGGFGPPRGFFNGPPEPFCNVPPPPLMMGQGFGPDGPPMRRRHVEDKGFKHLLRCGIAKENLKGLPKRLLKLIDPQFCGLCGLGFDSFIMSRMHYISKNHSKNQKKFLKRGPDGEVRAKEIPLKARELYCELCDVQITSKAHADAHYAGRPHRGIVEGRKQPKNPFLLQRGMESRVEQLIRREKKALKTVEEVEDTQLEKEEDKKVSTPPELYCEICKTCVTCSEQMTMHLNGKRHLTKEKQHILKMMKGDNSGSKTQSMDAETEDAADGDAADEDEDEGQAEQQKETGETDEKKVSDDWENGEKWEDASIF